MFCLFIFLVSVDLFVLFLIIAVIRLAVLFSFYVDQLVFFIFYFYHSLVDQELNLNINSNITVIFASFFQRRTAPYPRVTSRLSVAP